jgi:Holliday junction resolvase RusA-like endonuclease
MQTIEFFAQGVPKGQPRPRAFARGGHAAIYDPGTAEGWKGQIAIGARPFIPKQPILGPVKLTLDFRLPRPKKHFHNNGALRTDAPIWCEKKPDADNYAKAVMDALTILRFWGDDCQVCVLKVRKAYGLDTGCNIKIEECEQ